MKKESDETVSKEKRCYHISPSTQPNSSSANVVVGEVNKSKGVKEELMRIMMWWELVKLKTLTQLTRT